MSSPHLMRWLAAAALVLALPATATPQNDVGDFQHHERRDEEGADRSLVATRSDDGLVVLAWQCTPTGMRVLTALGWRWVGNEDDDIIVVHRFPADSSGTETLWRLSATGTVAWMRIGNIAGFTDAALTADSVLLTLSDPFDGESRDAAFSLVGLRSALDRLDCDLRRPSTSPPGGFPRPRANGVRP